MADAKYKTALEALKTCLSVWQWLREVKSDSKEAAYDALGLSRDLCYCPACEFAMGQTLSEDYDLDEMSRCAYCPLYPNQGAACHCEVDGEPWADWCEHDYSDRYATSAQRMVQLIQTRIAELTKESK